MENDRFPLASIIIVNHNGENYLGDLFQSLSRQTFRNFEVVFVDGGSNDNSLAIAAEFAAKRYFSMEIVKKKTNLGFCKGNNVGISIAKGQYIVFLNNDTYVESNWLEELVKRATSDDRPGVVASMIANPNSGFAFLGLLYDLYGASWAKDASSSDSEGDEFFYGSGAALLARKDVLDYVGAFDPALFMYQDEVDLCWRIRLAGYKISYAKNAKCYHRKPGVSTVRENLHMPVWKFYHAHGKNRIRVLAKNYSLGNIVKRLPAAIILISLRALMLMAINRKSQYISAALKGFIWNLLNIGDTMAYHLAVQRLRKTSDYNIQKFMLSHSIELAMFLTLVAHRATSEAKAPVVELHPMGKEL